MTEEEDVGRRVKGYLFFITRYMVLDTSLRMERSRDYEDRVDFWKKIVDRLPMFSN